MASSTEKQANLLSYAPLSLSAPDDQEQYSRKPQELPVHAEQIHSEFSPGEEYSTNNQPEEQQPELQAEVARPQEIRSHLSLYAAGTLNMRIHSMVQRFGLQPFNYLLHRFFHDLPNDELGRLIMDIWATPPMVKIPYKMMLDVLLESLALPPTEYQSKQCGGARVCVTVFFHTPTSNVGDNSSRMAIPGVQYVKYAMSEDTAAMEALGYIKCIAKTEIRDYNYSTMKMLKEENESLKHELAIAKKNKQKMKMKTRTIKNKLMIAKYKNKNNAMGWFVLARYVNGLSDHISNVTALNKSSGKEPIDQLINGPLNNIEKVAERLRRRVIKSEKKFRAIRRGF